MTSDEHKQAYNGPMQRVITVVGIALLYLFFAVVAWGLVTGDVPQLY